MTSEKFHKLFDAPPRTGEAELTQFHMDMAASVQAVTEEDMLRVIRYVHEQPGMETLCLAGGVALNWVGYGKSL